MLGLGLATSHAPSMFRGLECWSPIHRVLTSGVPQPPEIDKETPAILQSYIERINHGFDALKEQIEGFKPDVLLIVGDDQAEVFTAANMPPFCVFTCAEVHGSLNIGLIGEPEEENHVTLRCHAELATHLFDELNRKGFDISESKELKPLGRPKRGLGHAFTRPTIKVTPKLDVPIIPLSRELLFPADAIGAQVLRVGPSNRARARRSTGKSGDHGLRRPFARSARAARRLDRYSFGSLGARTVEFGKRRCSLSSLRVRFGYVAKRYGRNSQLDRRSRRMPRSPRHHCRLYSRASRRHGVRVRLLGTW